MCFKAFVLFTLVSCSHNSGVVKLGDNHYKIYKRAATGFAGGSNVVKSEIVFQANDFCGKQQKTARVMNEVLGSPPYVAGNFPKAQIEFTCVNNAPPRDGNLYGKNVYDEIRELKKLFDEGIITEKEFVDKKNILLNQ